MDKIEKTKESAVEREKISFEITGKDLKLLKIIAKKMGLTLEQLALEMVLRSSEEYDKMTQYQRLARSAGEGIARDLLHSLDKNNNNKS
ncbi:hypothetical protein ACFL35_14910 [Candidatus Riflebacteria bacterium]